MRLRDFIQARLRLARRISRLALFPVLQIVLVCHRRLPLHQFRVIIRAAMKMGELNYLLLQLMRALKEQQIQARAYKTILVAVMEATRSAPGLSGSLSQELLRVRPSLEKIIEPEYLELEQALLDDSGVRQRLEEFLQRHQ
jgi:hypothetical protein